MESGEVETQRNLDATGKSDHIDSIGIISPNSPFESMGFKSTSGHLRTMHRPQVTLDALTEMILSFSGDFLLRNHGLRAHRTSN